MLITATEDIFEVVDTLAANAEEDQDQDVGRYIYKVEYIED